jgi:hypothetical protein
MFDKIIQKYTRILKIAGSVMVASFVFLFATDTYLFNWILNRREGLFDVIVVVAVISVGVLIFSSILYIIAILRKVLVEGYKLISKREIVLLIIAILLFYFFTTLFFNEFYPEWVRFLT